MKYVIERRVKVPYVNCSLCNLSLHISPTDIESFNKRFVEGEEPFHCYECFKRLSKNWYKEMKRLNDKTSDPVMKELIKQMIEESENLL